MTPDQARKSARRLEQDLLVAEAEQATLGWMYLTVEGIDIESEPDLERYLRALDAFGEVAAGRQCRYGGRPSTAESGSEVRPPRLSAGLASLPDAGWLRFGEFRREG